MKEKEIKIIPQSKYLKFISCDHESFEGLEHFVNELKSFLEESERHSININFYEGHIHADLYRKETMEEAHTRIENGKKLTSKLKAIEALKFLENNEELLSKLKSGVSIDILKSKYE